MAETVGMITQVRTIFINQFRITELYTNFFAKRFKIPNTHFYSVRHQNIVSSKINNKIAFRLLEADIESTAIAQVRG